MKFPEGRRHEERGHYERGRRRAVEDEAIGSPDIRANIATEKQLYESERELVNPVDADVIKRHHRLGHRRHHGEHREINDPNEIPDEYLPAEINEKRRGDRFGNQGRRRDREYLAREVNVERFSKEGASEPLIDSSRGPIPTNAPESPSTPETLISPTPLSPPRSVVTSQGPVETSPLVAPPRPTIIPCAGTPANATTSGAETSVVSASKATLVTSLLSTAVGTESPQPATTSKA
jgi:hypothetical protein